MNKYLKSAGFAAALAIPALMLGVPATSNAQQAGHFDDATLRGDYGFAFSGTLEANDPPLPVSAVGQVRFSGDGLAISAVRTLSVGGTVFHQTASGTYTVKSDGTGSAKFQVITIDPPNSLPPSTERFEFVLENHGNNVQFISTTPGVVARGRLVRQDPASQ